MGDYPMPKNCDARANSSERILGPDTTWPRLIASWAIAYVRVIIKADTIFRALAIAEEGSDLSIRALPVTQRWRCCAAHGKFAEGGFIFALEITT
jgi:hypothetical protein